VDSLTPTEAGDIRVIQMSGGFLCEENMELMPANMVRKASEKLHATPLFLNAPLFVENEMVCRSLREDPLNKYLYQQYDMMDICLFGVSDIHGINTMQMVNALTQADVQ